MVVAVIYLYLLMANVGKGGRGGVAQLLLVFGVLPCFMPPLGWGGGRGRRRFAAEIKKQQETLGKCELYLKLLVSRCNRSITVSKRQQEKENRLTGRMKSSSTTTRRY